MDGPIVETAQFTPIVAIAVQVLGSDVPQYVAVDNGQPTVFPPTFEWAPNTNHTLTAEENVSCGSFLSINFCMYKFYGWSVDGVQHSEKTLNVKADKTKTITVTYEKNYFNPLEFAIIGALLVVVVLLLVFRRRRRPERPKPAPNLPSPPSGLAYKVGFLSDLGRNRSNNEDAILAMESLTAFGSKSNSAILSAVADGVGGSQKGEVASKLTLTTLAAHVSPSLVDSEGKDRMKTLTAAVEAANEQVVKYGMAHRESEGLASTLVVSLIEGNAAYIANVGDSRAYLVNRGGIKQLTKDHSQVQELVDAGKLTSDQSRHSVGRNVITRAIGASTNVQVDTYSVSLSPGDRLLMCTDGLWEPVEDAEIHKLVMQSTDPQAACESLVALANERGGKDNLSVIIVELKLASEQKQVT
jgi:protein phosphatase